MSAVFGDKAENTDGRVVPLVFYLPQGLPSARQTAVPQHVFAILNYN